MRGWLDRHPTLRAVYVPLAVTVTLVLTVVDLLKGAR